MYFSRKVKKIIVVYFITILSALLLYKFCSANIVIMLDKCIGPAFLRALNKPKTDVLFLWSLRKFEDIFIHMIAFLILLSIAQVTFLAYSIKRIKKITITAIALILLLLCMRYYYITHSLNNFDYFVDIDSSGKDLYPGLSKWQLLMLGWAADSRSPKNSSYLFKPIKKRDGTIRIGIFDGSMGVVGGEGHTQSYCYPFLLQNDFVKAGMKNVEIINFSVHGYGLTQEYMLFQFIGKKYGIDYAVFGTTMPTRETDFVRYTGWGPLHARFIIKDNGIKFVPVVGRNRFEACNIFHSIFPPWRYFKYAKNLPSLLKVLLPRSLHDRQNPFYYMRGSEEHAIYSGLFNRLSKQVKHLIIISDFYLAAGLRDRITDKNVISGYLQSRYYIRHFLMSFNAHPVRLGNQMIADELFSFLTGEKAPKFKDIILRGVMNGSDEVNRRGLSPLYVYDDISIGVKKECVAKFAISNTKLSWCYDEVDFKKEKIASLLLLPYSMSGDIKFVPSRKTWRGRTPIFLVTKTQGKTIKTPVGFIDLWKGVIGKMVLNYEKEDSRSRGVAWKYGQVVLNGPISRDAYIMAEDTKLLIVDEKSSNDKLVLFKPIMRDYIYLRSHYEYFVDKEPLKEEAGVLDLILNGKSGPEINIPLFSYQFVQAKPQVFAQPITVKLLESEKMHEPI